MGFIEYIKSLISSNHVDIITWKVDPYEGIDFMMPTKALAAPEDYARSNLLFGFQLTYLKTLCEESRAEKNANGFTIPSSVVPILGEDFTTLFKLPPLFPGKYQTRIEGNSARSSFSLTINLVLTDGSNVLYKGLYGPFIKIVEDEIYRVPVEQWQALTAVDHHTQLDVNARGEYENNWLIFQLQLAKKAGMEIDLAHFNNLELLNPESIGLYMEELPDGGVLLTPSFGSNIDIKTIKSRLGQIPENSDHCIFRAGNKFVLLDKKRLEAANEILTNKIIPKDQVSSFLKSPTAYLNAALIDLDTGFSLRVHGAERFTHRYFGDVEKSGVDWFDKKEAFIEATEQLITVIDSEDKLCEAEALIKDAQGTGSDIVELDGHSFDISDSEKVDLTLNGIRKKIEDGNVFTPSEPTSPETDESLSQCDRAVVAIDSNDEDIEFGADIRVTGLNLSQQKFSENNLKRSPFPHQREGITWMLAHLGQIETCHASSGALLADDMGLGKTYMILVTAAEWYRRYKEKEVNAKPVLIVAPLSLIENWQSEVEETFHKSPFSDIVVLQRGGDLNKFKVKGSRRETSQEFSGAERIEEQDKIRYSLKVGANYGSERLDSYGRMVLTTYQTLRDYQFSLSRVDWSIAVFDEAQNLKNPNTLATLAAKALKADFKLLATGTPVENSLKDFWCLMDTATPGLLGAWQSFRQEYISPITSADTASINDVKIDVGRKLRRQVGHYMLRRTKAEKLPDLPEKIIFSGDRNSVTENYLPELAATMNGKQLDCYNDIIAAVKNSSTENKRGLILPSLRRLKVTCIHHGIEKNPNIPKTEKELLHHAQESGKIKSMLGIIRDIEKREEKVLIFAETKSIQAYIAMLISTLFKVSVDIINGDSKAVATKNDRNTRKVIIDRFQSREGFGAIVMSPIAAGVGLTVVGANNVIHLERHWNPAKEAQATDRVYRIGQKSNVNVYLPMALHPELRSFDLQLNSLLSSKIDLSEAVVVTNAVEAKDLEQCF